MTIYKRLLAVIICSLFLLGATGTFAIQKNKKKPKQFGLAVDSISIQSAKALAGEPVNFFAENGFGKPLQTIQHPSGEYYKGVTYLAYQGPQEDPYVCSYNHNTKVWIGPIKAGISALGKKPNRKNPGKIDNHG